MRYCFRSDGEGHNFMIPIQLSNKFSQMLEEGEKDWYASFCNEFNEYSIDAMTNWSFEDPKEDM